MITGVAPGATGMVASTSDDAGVLPVLDRAIHEHADPAIYRHVITGRPERMAAVQVTLSGCGRAWPGGVQRGPGLPVPPGTCLAFVYGQRLVYAADGPWEFAYANLTGSAARSMLGELTARHGHILPVDRGEPAIARLIALATGPGIRHRWLDRAASMRLACDLICTLVAGVQREADPQRDLLDQACAALLADLAGDVATAAAECGVSREHLSRLFRRRLGLPPAAWLRRERLRHAELLLRGGRQTVAEVARGSGFATASHFVQAFRRSRGVTPGRWRG